MISIDNHKLMYHPERVAEWKEKGDCYPIYVEIGPTNSCNHNCIFCAVDWVGRDKDFIDKKTMLETLDSMANLGVKSVMFAGEGESLLHKDIGLFTKKAKQSGMDASITTNGIPVTKQKREECLPNLSWIRFSIDAGTAETYSKIHQTKKEDFNKLLHNIEESVRFKKKNNLETIIGAQFLLIPQNLEEVQTFSKLFKKIGVDNIQIKPYSQHPNSINELVVKYKDYVYLGEKLKKLNSNNFEVFFRGETMERLENANYHKCYGLPFFALIDAKGNVLPCNLFYNNKKFTYGNLYKNNFPQILGGKQRKDVIERLKIKGVSKCRAGCRLDAINRYLHRIKNPEKHDNFL